MSALRYDVMTGEWVAIATSRESLPVDPALRAWTAAESRVCPFCPGHESDTEETVAADLAEDGRWLVRVVRNRFPTFSRDAVAGTPAAGGIEQPACGTQEVIVEARDHDRDLADLEIPHLARALRMYRDRFRALAALDDVQSVAVFRNRGMRAGSSQSHPHAQVVATTVLPPALASRDAIAGRHASEHRTALLDSIVATERNARVRIISDGDFVIFCPFAPHRVGETWIVPATRQPSFDALPDASLPSFARALAATLRRVRHVFGDVAYNLVVRTPAIRSAHPDVTGWHLEVLPRTGGDAGFELSSGIDVVSLAPEIAAERLRAAPLE